MDGIFSSKECVLRNRGSKELPRNTIEEQGVAVPIVIVK